MGSLQYDEAETRGEGVAGMGVEVYRWMVRTLSLSGRRGAMAYRRLDGAAGRKKKRVRVARFGSNKRKPRALRIKGLRLRMRLSWLSPFTLLAKLRDVYVSFLQSASNKLSLTEGLAPFPGLPCDFGASPLAGSSLTAKEAELDKILALYLARARPHQLLLTDGAAA